MRFICWQWCPLVKCSEQFSAPRFLWAHCIFVHGTSLGVSEFLYVTSNYKSSNALIHPFLRLRPTISLLEFSFCLPLIIAACPSDYFARFVFDFAFQSFCNSLLAETCLVIIRKHCNILLSLKIYLSILLLQQSIISFYFFPQSVSPYYWLDSLYK